MIGGLISSTVLSIIITPVIYKLIPPRVTNNRDEAIKTSMPFEKISG